MRRPMGCSQSCAKAQSSSNAQLQFADNSDRSAFPKMMSMEAVKSMLEMDHIFRSLNSFTLDLAHKCAEDAKKENFTFSPFSINVALGMLYSGAKGSTATEMTSVLKLPSGDKADAIHEKFEKASEILKVKDQGINIFSANCMFVQRNFAVKSDFSQLLQKHYMATAKDVDFVEATDSTCEEINKWVADNTNQKIKTIIDSKIPDIKDTRLLLVNALYFEGKWKSTFDSSCTGPADFHVTREKTVQVDVMSQTSYFRCADLPNLKSRAVEMPYVDNKTVMFIVLPDEVDGINQLEANIKFTDIEKMCLDLQCHYTYLSVPRFKVEKTLELKPLLQKLGLNEVFKAGADLSGISEKHLCVASILQKCFLQVDEEGTVAAAATSCRAIFCCVPYDFRVDHPFLFIMYNYEANAILFMGSIREP